jgi:hypothetical protein
MGIAIMLRIKISPQAVVTIQTAIPKLISSLILVTFSYAIVGLLIDVSYFVQAFVINLILSSSQGTNTSPVATLLQKIIDGVGSLFSNPDLSSDIVNTVTDLSVKNLTNMGFIKASFIITQFVPYFMIEILGGILGTIVGGIGGGTITGLLGGGILAMIFTIIIFVLLIKFFIGLIKAYFNLILKIITGPLEIAMGALPNSKMGFSSWILDVVANLAVFPICSIYIVLIYFIINQISYFGTLWTPSLLTLGILTSTPTIAIRLIIGIGAILLLPKLPTMIPEFIFMIKPSPWGKAIGESFGSIPGGKLVSKGVQTGAKSGVQLVDDVAGTGTGNRFWNKAITAVNKVVNK